MPSIYEYGDWVEIDRPQEMKRFLKDIWETYQDSIREDQELEEDDFKERNQPFLSFDGSKIKGRNYVGFIQDGDQLIEIYPKVFREHSEFSPDHKKLMYSHLFFWLSYCRKWQFPFTDAEVGSDDIESLPELIINLIATKFLKVITEQPLTTYHMIEEALTSPRGKINFGRYVNNSLSYGNFHIVECDHEPFAFDNQLNRIIKYCARLLMNRTQMNENLRLLQEVLFVLDDVSDEACSLAQTNNIQINPFFDDYVVILDLCRQILMQRVYSSSDYELKQWCLLLPMEYIFEDFFAGFLDEHFSHKWKIEYQKSDCYLTSTPKAFRMQHDIYLTPKQYGAPPIIVDTKYKLRDTNFKSDLKKGISQSDLYQMTSYAFRRGCNDVLLVYPNTVETLNTPDSFEIDSGFDDQVKLRVRAIEVPFWSLTDFQGLKANLILSIEESLFSSSNLGSLESQASFEIEEAQ